MSGMKHKYLSALVCVGVAVLLLMVQTSAALAATAPPLGAAESFGVLGASAVTNTGSSVINGDLGIFPGSSITGFPPGIVNGTVHATDGVAQQAQADALVAYNFLASQAYDVDMSGLDLGGRTLGPGVYFFSSSALLTGTLTLDAQNNPNSVFIFQIKSALTTGTNAKIALINAPPNFCKKYFQVGTSATLGTGTQFVGDIIADQSITMVTGAILDGRAFALNGAVTMDTVTITVPVCPIPTPTLSGWGFILLIGLLVSVGFFALRKSGRLSLG